MSEWQPIETAPKSSAENILLCKMDGWMTSHPFPYIGWYHEEKREWVNLYDGKGQYQPTHWMPVPNPPNVRTGLT